MRQATLLFVVAVESRELFVPGKPLQSRRISARVFQDIKAVCDAEENANRKYCNGGGSNTACDANGIFVSIDIRGKYKMRQIKNKFSTAM